MKPNEKGNAANIALDTLGRGLTMKNIQQNQIGINTILPFFALPKTPSRLLKGIVDICPDCCKPLEYAGIKIINDRELKIKKILCWECYDEMGGCE